MGKKAESTALTVLQDRDYTLAKFTAEKFTEALSMNFGTEKLKPSDLDKIKIPASSGPAMWAVPSVDGETVTKEVEGVIVLHRNARAYWEKSIDETGGGDPPDCSSADGETGVGSIGGTCEVCPMNQFETDHNKRGKACKEMKLLFLVTKDSLLPFVMVLPPTSLGSYKKYLMRLTSGAVPYHTVVSRFALTEKSSKAGQKYYQVVCEMAERLDEQSIAHIKKLIEPLQSAFEAVTINQTDAKGGAEADPGPNV